MKGLIGRKLGMTQVFSEEGAALPVTLIESGPCYVTQVKTREKDGYRGVQLGFEEISARRISGGRRGHLRRNQLPGLRILREVRLRGEVEFKEGQKLTADVFAAGDYVDVVGVSKGKGFQGGMKRHGFGGGPKTHGQSDRQRSPGSIGATSTPGRVLKGTRMAGRMGGGRVTAQNLKVALVDAERNLIGVRGAVPGPKGGIVLIREVRKQ
ncbi:MAG: 50S ribosomal protein L3 [Anaerolineales bacterium]|jgi:large subunit ribosomal protein L3|nr:50S ribosomal protein L3 [Anaerolineaceae bacterium]MDP7345411.1 50S ribosomal protein L3 [Anaerolineales bacterium]MDP7544145.1 50S ribosomal protein L3 [Anaerolineales bacterium]MDP7643721.1 50S ribosomal protein L3 [Anaerolineales bacterium]HJL69507.1 50S ribosomal protein L3 [Anaerolineales bacterium]|tara:strand:+ start:696 stop:1325 length:630 start_codon:yes stop_codon:yes gene_type:complete